VVLNENREFKFLPLLLSFWVSMIQLPHPAQPLKIPSWNLPELEEFLKHSNGHENLFWDFKEMPEAKEQTRKTFSSFANKDGGFVFYGITDTRQVVGIKNTAEKLNDWLTDVLRAIQPNISYESLHVIVAPDGRTVPIYFIRPSLPHQKPYMADHFIFIRENGASRNGKQFRFLKGHRSSTKLMMVALRLLDRFFPDLPKSNPRSRFYWRIH
jgi:Putative DNA-binding domain